MIIKISELLIARSDFRPSRFTMVCSHFSIPTTDEPAHVFLTYELYFLALYWFYFGG